MRERDERGRLQLDAQLLQPLPGRIVTPAVEDAQVEVLAKATQLFRSATVEPF